MHVAQRRKRFVPAVTHFAALRARLGRIEILTAMSFRLFIYYCALCGGGGAFLGWVLGRPINLSNGILTQGLKGMFLGLSIAWALALVDALWMFSLRRLVAIGLRMTTAVAVGTLGGLLGGLVGQNPSPALRKIFKGILGGTLGGIFGGILYLLMLSGWTRLLRQLGGDQQIQDRLWSPSAWSFVALGMCIGLLIGLAQVILKEAWLRVETGFRTGREIIIAKPEVTIGRAEKCDIGLFGDPQIEKLHARILQENNRYVLMDEGADTYVNDDLIHGPRILRSGDAIRIGKSVLRFGERQKQTHD